MNIRVAWLTLAYALIVPITASSTLPGDTDAVRAAEERALRAQIAQMDGDRQSLETQLRAMHSSHSNDPSGEAQESALRSRIHRIDDDQQLLEARIQEIRRERANPPTVPGSGIGQATFSDPAGANDRLPRQPSPPAPTSTYAPTGPALRQAADPAPYEAAADTRIAMFRTAFSLYRWIPVGSRQLVVFNTYDEAYLLDFANDCPGLLSAARIRFENFSTRVKAGEHAVIADGQRCLIITIRTLRISKLPKALRP